MSVENTTDLAIRLVENFQERCLAWNLVYRKYREQGFVLAHPSGLHFSMLDLLPTSLTWIAHHKTKLVGTMSLVFHSSAGLPCGLDFEEDLRRFGIDGKVICEFTKLAVDVSSRSLSNLSLLIVGSMIHWCHLAQVDDLICVVHPKHGHTWSHVFGWKALGEIRGHAGVNNNPGILLHLDLWKVFSSLSSIPARGRKILHELQQQYRQFTQAYRLSGCEAATLLLQRLEVAYQSNVSQRIALERHYPWASTLVYSFLYSHVKGWANGFSDLLPSKPARDRSFKVSNHLSKLRLFSGNHRLSLPHWDQLFVPESPMVLVVGDTFASCETVSKVFEQANFIVFGENHQEAMNLLSQHIFDVVLLNAARNDEAVLELSNLVRTHDAFFRIHTPIISINALLNHEKHHGIDLASEEHSISISEVACATALTKTLHVIIGDIEEHYAIAVNA